MRCSNLRRLAAPALIFFATAARGGAFSDLPADTSAAPAPASPSASAPAFAPAVAGAVPSDADLRSIRHTVGKRTINLLEGDRHLRLDHAVIDSAGVSFQAWRQGYAPFVYKEWGLDTLNEIRAGELPAGTTLVSWSRIDRIEILRSHALRGAAIGAFAGGLLAGVQVSALAANSDDALGLLIIAPAEVVASTLLGTLIGGLAPGRTVVWRRPPRHRA
jgi:hypothetical protein